VVWYTRSLQKNGPALLVTAGAVTPELEVLMLPHDTSSLRARFWTKVDKSGDCWLWTAARWDTGYGQFMVGGKLRGAHRVSYELAKGPIPAGMLVCHTCDNPRCVRPSHLWLGTVRDNAQDAARKGRTASGDRNGKRLHPERYPHGDNHPMRLHPELVTRGERNGRAKLTDDNVREIRTLAAQGVQGKQLAERYGVSRTKISRVIRCLDWRHVE